MKFVTKYLFNVLTVMKRSLLFLYVIISLTQARNLGFGQSNFTGMLEYSIVAHDTMYRQLYPENKMIIYTNDTIVRQVNYTQQLGEQVTIRHMEKNKSYLLLNTDFGKFAIQSDLNKLVPDSVQKVSKYHFKKKGGSKKYMGLKLKRMLVTHEDTEEIYEFWYAKKIPVKYNNAFTELPGLPVMYSVVTPDYVLDYTLIKINPYTPNRDLFGVPSDYERTTFDAFVEKMIKHSTPRPEGN